MARKIYLQDYPLQILETMAEVAEREGAAERLADIQRAMLEATAYGVNHDRKPSRG